LPADVVDLTVEIREEPEEEVVPESPIWDREEELSMDDEEDGRVADAVFRIRPNLLNQLVLIGTPPYTSDSVGEEEHMPSTEPLVIQDFQAEVELQRLEAREEGYVEDEPGSGRDSGESGRDARSVFEDDGSGNLGHYPRPPGL